MKYKAKNAAMQVINRTAELANKQEYIDSLNKATGKVEIFDVINVGVSLELLLTL